MLSRADLEAREVLNLASYATLSQNARREQKEAESLTRTAFQKDRDRVLHTTAFRRLEAKTQVFLNPRGDHYRTRLTHTLEVQQVARSVALSLRLNEALAETLSLAHDLGHPPFGHAGERILNELMSEWGGFNHNLQTRRIVTVLEEHSLNMTGLNLTDSTLDGLMKHGRGDLGQLSLEAQVVDAADALAYTAHDLDDGLRSGLVSGEQLGELELWQELLVRTDLSGKTLSAGQRRLLHRELLGWLIQDLSENSDKAIRSSQVTSLAQVREMPKKLIGYSPAVSQKLEEVSGFLRQNLYKHWQLEMQVEQARRIIETMFSAFSRRPEMLPDRPRARLQTEVLQRVICDHIAGMTDRYAIESHARITPPNWLH